MPEDQVDDVVKTSDQDAGALDEQKDTQGDDRQVTEEVTTTEAQPSVEELQATIEKQTADLEKSDAAFKAQQSRADTAERQLHPFTEAQRQADEARLKDDETFQARAAEIGFVAAQRELIQAQNRLDQAAQVDYDVAKTNQKMWDKATNETDAYAKEKGVSPAEVEIIRQRHNYFRGSTPEGSVELAKILIDKEADVKVTAQANVNMLTKAEDDTRRKIGGQVAAGASPGGIEKPAQPGSAAAVWEKEKAELAAAAKNSSGDII